MAMELKGRQGDIELLIVARGIQEVLNGLTSIQTKVQALNTGAGGVSTVQVSSAGVTQTKKELADISTLSGKNLQIKTPTIAPKQISDVKALSNAYKELTATLEAYQGVAAGAGRIGGVTGAIPITTAPIVSPLKKVTPPVVVSGPTEAEALKASRQALYGGTTIIAPGPEVISRTGPSPKAMNLAGAKAQMKAEAEVTVTAAAATAAATQGGIALDKEAIKQKLILSATTKKIQQEMLPGLKKQYPDLPLGVQVQSVDETMQRVTKRIASYAFIYGVVRVLKEAVTAAMQLQTEMVQLMKVMEPTTDFPKLQRDLFDVSKAYGVSIKTVIASATSFAQLGLNQVQVVEMTKASLLAMNSANMSAAESVNFLTSAMFTFNIQAEGMTRVIDKLMVVHSNYRVVTDSLAKSIELIGPLVMELGGNMDLLLGYVAAISVATQKSGTMITQSLKMMFSRLSQEDVIRSLEHVGVMVRKSQDELRPLGDIMGDLSRKWKDLSGGERIDLAKKIGGSRNASDMIALMDHYNIAMKASFDASVAWGESTTANAMQIGTLRQQLVIIGTTLAELAAQLERHGLITLLTDIVWGLNKFLSLLKELPISGMAVVGVIKLVQVFGGILFSNSKLLAGIKSKLWTEPWEKLKVSMQETAAVAKVVSSQIIASEEEMVAAGLAVNKAPLRPPFLIKPRMTPIDTKGMAILAANQQRLLEREEGPPIIMPITTRLKTEEIGAEVGALQQLGKTGAEAGVAMKTSFEAAAGASLFLDKTITFVTRGFLALRALAATIGKTVLWVAAFEVAFHLVGLITKEYEKWQKMKALQIIDPEASKKLDALSEKMKSGIMVSAGTMRGALGDFVLQLNLAGRDLEKQPLTWAEVTEAMGKAKVGAGSLLEIYNDIATNLETQGKLWEKLNVLAAYMQNEQLKQMVDAQTKAMDQLNKFQTAMASEKTLGEWIMGDQKTWDRVNQFLYSVLGRTKYELQIQPLINAKVMHTRSPKEIAEDYGAQLQAAFRNVPTQQMMFYKIMWPTEEIYKNAGALDDAFATMKESGMDTSLERYRDQISKTGKTLAEQLVPGLKEINALLSQGSFTKTSGVPSDNLDAMSRAAIRTRLELTDLEVEFKRLYDDILSRKITKKNLLSIDIDEASYKAIQSFMEKLSVYPAELQKQLELAKRKYIDLGAIIDEQKKMPETAPGKLSKTGLDAVIKQQDIMKQNITEIEKALGQMGRWNKLMKEAIPDLELRREIDFRVKILLPENLKAITEAIKSQFEQGLTYTKDFGDMGLQLLKGQTDFYERLYGIRKGQELSILALKTNAMEKEFGMRRTTEDELHRQRVESIKQTSGFENADEVLARLKDQGATLDEQTRIRAQTLDRELKGEDTKYTWAVRTLDLESAKTRVIEAQKSLFDILIQKQELLHEGAEKIRSVFKDALGNMSEIASSIVKGGGDIPKRLFSRLSDVFSENWTGKFIDKLIPESIGKLFVTDEEEKKFKDRVDFASDAYSKAILSASYVSGDVIHEKMLDAVVGLKIAWAKMVEETQTMLDQAQAMRGIGVSPTEIGDQLFYNAILDSSQAGSKMYSDAILSASKGKPSTVIVPKKLAVESKEYNIPKRISVESPKLNIPKVIAVESPKLNIPKTIALESPKLNMPKTIDVKTPKIDIPKTINLTSPKINIPKVIDIGPFPKVEIPKFINVNAPDSIDVKVPKSIDVRVPRSIDVSAPKSIDVTVPKITVTTPDIKIPKTIDLNVPKITVPDIKVPKSINVSVPKITVPTPDLKIPKTINLRVPKIVAPDMKIPKSIDVSAPKLSMVAPKFDIPKSIDVVTPKINIPSEIGITPGSEKLFYNSILGASQAGSKLYSDSLQSGAKDISKLSWTFSEKKIKGEKAPTITISEFGALKPKLEAPDFSKYRRLPPGFGEIKLNYKPGAQAYKEAIEDGSMAGSKLLQDNIFSSIGDLGTATGGSFGSLISKFETQRGLWEKLKLGGTTPGQFGGEKFSLKDWWKSLTSDKKALGQFGGDFLGSIFGGLIAKGNKKTGEYAGTGATIGTLVGGALWPGLGDFFGGLFGGGLGSLFSPRIKDLQETNQHLAAIENVIRKLPELSVSLLNMPANFTLPSLAHGGASMFLQNPNFTFHINGDGLDAGAVADEVFARIDSSYQSAISRSGNKGYTFER